MSGSVGLVPTGDATESLTHFVPASDATEPLPHFVSCTNFQCASDIAYMLSDAVIGVSYLVLTALIYYLKSQVRLSVHAGNHDELVHIASVASLLIMMFVGACGSVHLLMAASLLLHGSRPSESVFIHYIETAATIMRTFNTFISAATAVYFVCMHRKLLDSLMALELIPVGALKAATQKLRENALAYARAQERAQLGMMEAARTKQAGLDLASCLLSHGPRVLGTAIGSPLPPAGGPVRLAAVRQDRFAAGVFPETDE